MLTRSIALFYNKYLMHFSILTATNRNFLVFLICLLSSTSSLLLAQGNSHVIKLRNNSLNLPENGQQYIDSLTRYSSKPGLFLVRLKLLPDISAQKELKQNGVQLISYLSDNTYIGRISPLKNRSTHFGFASILPFQDQWKIAPALSSLSANDQVIDLIVSFVPGSDPQQIRKMLLDAGASIAKKPINVYGFYEISLPARKLKDLSTNVEVLYIGPAAKNVPLNLESQRDLKVNIAHTSVANGGYGLLGDSITLGVGDNVPGLWHVDLRDRIINYNPSPYANHGQHTNGTVGGAGTVDPRGEGFAPHAILVDEIYDLIWQRTGPLLHAYNMHATNNSYANIVGSCPDAGVYDIYAQVLDTVILNYPDVMHLFAAGNDGNLNCGSYPAGYGTVTGGYQASKNALVVGNVTKQNIINAGSSRGPLKDGRLKPEICAVGSGVYSTKGGDIYLSASGTSMATPQITGTTGLLQQRFKQLHSGAYPSSALLKALLINGALDLGTPGPDYTFGYGVADFSRSKAMIDNNWYVNGSINNGALQNPSTITVPPNTGQLKVLLYWHDVPASPSSSNQLINDLDLTLTDPSSTNHLPFILNPSPALVANPATYGADHINNVEQVVIDNPVAGNYVVNVSGFNVPSGPQAYVVVYDLVPTGITITTPFKNDAFKSGDWLNFYWNASPGTNTFTAEISLDNGSTWTVLSNSIAATERGYLWTTNSGINSNQCLFRVTRNGTGEQSTSALFTINEQPLLSFSSNQCPGYAVMHWNPVKTATNYNILQKIGPFLHQVATTTDTNYVASGLSTDSTYYFSVEPMLGSRRGYRSMAISRKPNNGNCSGSYSDGDLRLSAITLPSTGRLGTSTALLSNQSLQVQVQNLDDHAATIYRVAYQINGSAWTSQLFTNIPANGTATATFNGLNLAAPGSYTIRAAVTNITALDGVHQNDTLQKTVRQLQNAPVNLASGFLEDFESMPALTLLGDSSGFSPNEHWDYHHSNDSGRLRSFVDEEITISGQRSLSMDLIQNAIPTLNLLTGTFDLSGVSLANDEVRMEFDYRVHGIPKYPDSNKVWVRGNDQAPWISLFNYDLSSPTGLPLNSGTLSLTDALRTAGQTFGTSTQIAFGQYDTAVIAQNDYGNGFTLDNVRIYKVMNDVGITSIVSPQDGNCQMPATSPLTIQVTNGVSTPVTDVYLFYQYDGGPVVKDSLLIIAGKSTVNFTFNQLLNTAALGSHTLNVWLVAPHDSYSANDSILGYVFRNQPLINKFPYLENFEGGDGSWYTSGKNSSWEYGTPNSKKVTRAASGTKAWKTNLTGTYNDNELSYLSSPCFDLTGLQKPMLSFSGAMQIENCGSTRCDGGWVEYSENGGIWTKLGATGQGTNWYTDSTFQIWNDQDSLRWKVSSIPIPTLQQPVRFRFVLSSDPGAGFEGMAIDDIHIYDRINPLYSGSTLSPPELNLFPGANYHSFLAPNNGVLAMINPNSSNLDKTGVSLYEHTDLMDRQGQQYVFPKNFVINSLNAATDSVSTRLFISDADVLRLINASGCLECSKPDDAYQLGITRYHNSDLSKENGSLSDNSGGTYEYTPYQRLKWVPYDNGYYAEFKSTVFSEFWFNDGGPGNSFSLTDPALLFDAQKIDANTVQSSWLLKVDTLASSYELQRATDASHFSAIQTVASIHDNAHTYTYNDLPVIAGNQALYYRVKYTLNNGKVYYSPIRQVIWSGRSSDAGIFPNPAPDGHFFINWSTQPNTALNLAISDVAGRVVLRNQTTAVDYTNLTEINMAGLAKGVYFLRLEIGGERFNFKIQYP